jgi:hypothetical protein
MKEESRISGPIEAGIYPTAGRNKNALDILDLAGDYQLHLEGKLVETCTTHHTYLVKRKAIDRYLRDLAQ